MSPLLANIALHGMEAALGISYTSQERNNGPRGLVRYADDFVVFCESQADAQKVVEELADWLKGRGLTLSEEKTRIVHLSEGFDFLGFNVKHYPCSTAKTGWKLLIEPSRNSIKSIKEKLKEKWISSRGHSMASILKALNPIIRGWANYHRRGVAFRTFEQLDDWMFRRQVRHVNHTHPKKPKKWKLRYWGRFNLKRQDRWCFGDRKTGAYLLKFRWFPIERHILVEGTASPDNPRLKAYWEKRQRAKASDAAPSWQKMAVRQNGNCPECGDSLFNGEEVHPHHIIPRKNGGRDTYTNLRLIHLYCHQQLEALSERERNRRTTRWIVVCLSRMQ